MRLEGQVALVTGASSGIGRAIAVLFAREGAELVCLDAQPDSRLAEETPSTVELIHNAGGKATFVLADVTRPVDLKRELAGVLEKHGRVGVLVNNAGIFVRNAITDVSLEEWERVLSINLRGYFLTCQQLIPHMIEHGGGSIVNVGSIHGIRGTGTAATYCASKGGVENLTKQLAVEYARHRIRVNSIAPGVIQTAMSKPFRETPEILAEYKARTLLPRLGVPMDVAYAALYLASNESDFVTGHTLIVDGGWTIW